MKKKIKKTKYTQIPNFVLEGMALSRLSGGEFACLLVLLRQTFGWHKKTDKVSLSQFMEKTRLSESTVVRSIISLQEKLIIGKINEKGTNEWILSYDYFQRVIDLKNITPQLLSKMTVLLLSRMTSGTVRNDREVLSEMTDTKETNQKKLIQKKIKKEFFSFETKAQSEIYPQEDLTSSFFKL